jgi:hypothetical protein
MRRTTLLELAARSGRPLPTTDPRELYRYDSLDAFLRVFWLAQSCLQTRDEWARLAYESVEDHPWPTMAASGLHLTLNSDDPAFIESDLGAEYAALAGAFGYAAGSPGANVSDLWVPGSAPGSTPASAPPLTQALTRVQLEHGAPERSRSSRLMHAHVRWSVERTCPGTVP